MIKNGNLGKLIVFEGIDGAGSETQSKLLFNYLRKKKRASELLTFPDYRGPIGNIIHKYLHKKYNFPVDVQLLLYLADFVKEKEKIKKWLEQGKIVICDRYFTSAISYQGVKGFPLKAAITLAKIFELPKPNLIVYLKISPKISIKRKYQEKKNLDRHEADRKFLEKLTKFYNELSAQYTGHPGHYKKLIENRTFGKWITVNGEKSINEVFGEIKKYF